MRYARRAYLGRTPGRLTTEPVPRLPIACGCCHGSAVLHCWSFPPAGAGGAVHGRATCAPLCVLASVSSQLQHAQTHTHAPDDTHPRTKPLGIRLNTPTRNSEDTSYPLRAHSRPKHSLPATSNPKRRTFKLALSTRR